MPKRGCEQGVSTEGYRTYACWNNSGVDAPDWSDSWVAVGSPSAGVLKEPIRKMLFDIVNTKGAFDFRYMTLSGLQRLWNIGETTIGFLRGSRDSNHPILVEIQVGDSVYKIFCLCPERDGTYTIEEPRQVLFSNQFGRVGKIYVVGDANAAGRLDLSRGAVAGFAESSVVGLDDDEIADKTVVSVGGESYTAVQLGELMECLYRRYQEGTL